MTTEAELRKIVLNCDDHCLDPDMHDFFMAGGGFVWQWPKLTVLHAAHRRTSAGLNRYPHNVIGAYVLVRGRGVGVTWKGSRRRSRHGGPADV